MRRSDEIAKEYPTRRDLGVETVRMVGGAGAALVVILALLCRALHPTQSAKIYTSHGHPT
jgi:hypothetical protein